MDVQLFPRNPSGGTYAMATHPKTGGRGRVWVESISTHHGDPSASSALVRFDPGEGMRSRVYKVPLSSVQFGHRGSDHNLYLPSWGMIRGPFGTR